MQEGRRTRPVPPLHTREAAVPRPMVRWQPTAVTRQQQANRRLLQHIVAGALQRENNCEAHKGKGAEEPQQTTQRARMLYGRRANVHGAHQRKAINCHKGAPKQRRRVASRRNGKALQRPNKRKQCNKQKAR